MTDLRQQIYCPICKTTMLLTEATKDGLIYLCPKCGFQLNISLLDVIENLDN